MRNDKRVINVAPGDVELVWDDDEPVLKLLEYRDGTIIVVRVKVGRFVAGAIAWSLHKIAKRYAERAADLLKSLREGT